MGSRLELLTNEEMARADRLAAARDVTSRALMENAGAAVAKAVAELLERHIPIKGHAGSILVVCGRSANGGDGFVAARHLSEIGHKVRVALMGSITQLRGDT